MWNLGTVLVFWSFVAVTRCIPVYLNEIELPTGDGDIQGVFDVDSDDILDLSRLSDGELLALERALQNKIEEIEAEQGFVEDSVPIIRDRRAGGRHIEEDSPVDLVPIIDEEDGSPIVIVDAPIEEPEEQFLLVPEPEDGEDARPIVLSANELDELELRQKIDELGDLLKERAWRGMM